MQRLEGYVETNISELRSIYSCAVGHFLELINLICADNFVIGCSFLKIKGEICCCLSYYTSSVFAYIRVARLHPRCTVICISFGSRSQVLSCATLRNIYNLMQKFSCLRNIYIKRRRKKNGRAKRSKGILRAAGFAFARFLASTA
jgi:hypothetical protein